MHYFTLLDDTFVYFDNLIKFLEEKDHTYPALYGYISIFWTSKITTSNYTLGGPGY